MRDGRRRDVGRHPDGRPDIRCRRLRLRHWSVRLLAGVLVAGGASVLPARGGVTRTLAQVGVTPIPMQTNASPVPSYIGAPATPNPTSAQPIPQNSGLAPDPYNNIHNDTYMSDTLLGSGPLGNTPQVVSTYLRLDCASVTFDSYGRIVTECQGQKGATLFVLDPITLATVASLALPPPTTSQQVFPGVYFYVDNFGRIIAVTPTNELWIVAESGGTTRPALVKKAAYSLSAAVPSTDSIVAVLPDGSGHLWFVTYFGTVGVVGGGHPMATMQLAGEHITNSFAVDPAGGIYIASDTAMYRFDLAADGTPAVTWREMYDRGTRIKPGQAAQGTGTTPTLMGDQYVTIADNADPYMHVLVYQRAATVSTPRLVCSQEVFPPYQGATEASAIATDSSIIIENNYGYSISAVQNGGTTVPGVTRVDLDSGGGCHASWTDLESAPRIVSKLSLGNGLIYTYTKDAGPGTTDAWYFTAIDVATGQTVYKVLAGTGSYYDSHIGSLAIGPNGRAYVAVLGGIVSISDGAGAGQ